MNLVKRIIAQLGQKEDVKIENFFKREIKKFERNLKALKQNNDSLTLILENDREELIDQISDAKDKLEHSYLSITLKDLTNNDSMEKFSELYWSNIQKNEKEIKQLEKTLEEKEKEYKKNIEENDEQIKKYQNRIDKIKNYE